MSAQSDSIGAEDCELVVAAAEERGSAQSVRNRWTISPREPRRRAARTFRPGGARRTRRRKSMASLVNCLSTKVLEALNTPHLSLTEQALGRIY